MDFFQKIKALTSTCVCIVAIAACSGHGSSPPIAATQTGPSSTLKSATQTSVLVDNPAVDLSHKVALANAAGMGPVPVKTSVCIGQTDGSGLLYPLVNHDEFDSDAALNTSGNFVAGDLNLTDAINPRPISNGAYLQTTWSSGYTFGHANSGLSAFDDSYYPSRANLTAWQKEYGASLYPDTIKLIPGVGVALYSYPDWSTTKTSAASYPKQTNTIVLSSVTGLAKGDALTIVGDPAVPIVTGISGKVVSLSTTTVYIGANNPQSIVGFYFAHPSGSAMGVIPADIESVVAPYGGRNEFGGMMDAQTNNAYHLGYWEFSAMLPTQPTDTSAGIWPSNWTLCEGPCQGSNNDYYEMDTFEQFGNLQGATGIHQTIQGENGYGPGPYTAQQEGPNVVSGAQYWPDTGGNLAARFHVYSQLATATNVEFYLDRKADNRPLNQVPAATNPNLPGVAPILIEQTCTVVNPDCGNAARTIAKPSVLMEQYYRYYKPGTAKCGPPFDVPPAVPATPPKSAGTIPSLVQGTPRDAVNKTGFGAATLGAGPALPTADDWLIASFAGNGYVAPKNWSSLINGGSQALFYCHVGTAANECPPASSYAFVGSNHGGIGHIREYSGLSGPPIPVTTPNPQYNNSAILASAIQVPSPNGLTQVMAAVEVDGPGASAVTSFTDALTGSLTTKSTDETFNVQGVSGSNGAYFSLYEANVVQDASFATQPVTNDQVFSAGALGNGEVYEANSIEIFLPGTLSITVQQLHDQLVAANRFAYEVDLRDLRGTDQPLDGTLTSNSPANSLYIALGAASKKPPVTANTLIAALEMVIASGRAGRPVEVVVGGQPYSLKSGAILDGSTHAVVFEANQAI